MLKVEEEKKWSKGPVILGVCHGGVSSELCWLESVELDDDSGLIRWVGFVLSWLSNFYHLLWGPWRLVHNFTPAHPIFWSGLMGTLLALTCF